MSSELKTLKNIFKQYANTNMTYTNVYNIYLHNTRNTGVYDNDTGILDKWLWKYSNYTPLQFIKLSNL